MASPWSRTVSGAPGPMSNLSAGHAPEPPPERPPPSFHLKTRIFYQGTETPVNGARWELVDPQGLVARTGTTSEDGLVIQDVAAAGEYTLRLVEVPPMPEGEAAAAAA